MSVDNLIRLGQIESGEFLSFFNQNATFYPSSDPSGLATEAYVGVVSGDLNAKIETVSGNLHSTGQDLEAQIAAHQGFPTGTSGQIQYAHEDGSFGATQNIFYDYENSKLGIGEFGGQGSAGLPLESLHISGGNVAISGGDLYVTGDIQQSGVSLYGYTELVSGNLYAEITGVSGWINPDFRVIVQDDGGGDKYWISDVGEETIHGVVYRKAPKLYLHKGSTYTFDFTATSNLTHSFYISSGSSNGGANTYTNEWLSGVSGSRADSETTRRVSLSIHFQAARE